MPASRVFRWTPCRCLPACMSLRTCIRTFVLGWRWLTPVSPAVRLWSQVVPNTLGPLPLPSPESRHGSLRLRLVPAGLLHPLLYFEPLAYRAELLEALEQTAESLPLEALVLAARVKTGRMGPSWERLSPGSDLAVWTGEAGAGAGPARCLAERGQGVSRPWQCCRGRKPA
jgi:hypothetical protein